MDNRNNSGVPIAFWNTNIIIIMCFNVELIIYAQSLCIYVLLLFSPSVLYEEIYYTAANYDSVLGGVAFLV